MNPELEPLPEDIAGLLRRGSSMIEPPAEVRRRLRDRLASALGGPVALPPAASRWGRLAAAAGRSRALIGLAGFAVGAATVLALQPSASIPAPAPTPAPRSLAPLIVQPEMPRTESAPVAPVAEVVPAPQIHPQQAVAQVHRRSHQPSTVAALDKPDPVAVQPAPVPAPRAAHAGLQAEGDLLQRGRTAMVRGDAEGALAAVEEHASKFPHGELAEEREALKIQALVSEDRDPEARAALGDFHRAYPHSLLGPALEEAVVGRFNDGLKK